MTQQSNFTIVPGAEDKPAFVNHMFARIAPTYDLMNKVMTGGQDRHWRRELLAYCDLPPHGRLLDVGTGTGDIAYEGMRRFPSVQAFFCRRELRIPVGPCQRAGH